MPIPYDNTEKLTLTVTPLKFEFPILVKDFLREVFPLDGRLGLGFGSLRSARPPASLGTGGSSTPSRLPGLGAPGVEMPFYGSNDRPTRAPQSGSV